MKSRREEVLKKSKSPNPIAKIAKLATIAIIFSFPRPTSAKTIEVPEDFKSVEDAVKAAEDGDLVLVSPGVYLLESDSSLVLKGDLILKSKKGPQQTAIEGRGLNPVVAISRKSTAVIDGFTITRAKNSGEDKPQKGGGIYCAQDSTPSIVNNIIVGNKAIFGGGIYCDRESSPTIEGNLIHSNHASVSGGGAMAHLASPVLANNRFVENKAEAAGAGILAQLAAPKIVNNIFFANNASNGGAIVCSESSCYVQNNTIVKNTAYQGGGIYVDGGSTKIINSIFWMNDDDLFLDPGDAAASRPEYNEIGDRDFWGVNGNISSDPKFADLDNGDLRLNPDSPCIDAGDPNPKFSDRDGSRNDMGAHGGPESGLQDRTILARQ